MKWILGVVLLAAMVHGCMDSSLPQANQLRDNPSGTVFTRIVHVRGCDYVVVSTSFGVAVVHAGDCPNPIHLAVGR